MRVIFLTTITLLILAIMSCNNPKKSIEKTIYIGADTKPCTEGVMETQCMQVKWTKNQKEWENFFGEIKGFDFEIGNEYELLVWEEALENPPADGSSLKWTLIKVISKKKFENTSNSESLKKPFTSSHVFTAKYEGISFHECMARTAMCPNKCGHSGNMANFKVLDYQDFVVNGQSGTEKLTNYQVLISDYSRKDIDKPYVADIKNLKKGDEVTVYVEYVYDTTKNNIQTVENIISITKNLTFDSHNSQNSLNWIGTYEGTLPCADCEGIKTIITLNKDNTFTKTESYIKNGKINKFETIGNIIWGKDGMTIMLKSKEDNWKYKIGEHTLTHLDINGKIIEGNFSNKYILKQK